MGTPPDSHEIPAKNLSPELASRTVESSQLFQGSKTLLIRHAGSEYRLTVTRNDKLILQK